MRIKHVPPPPDDLDAVAEARLAVPLVPSPEGECSARLAGRLDLESRDVARTWLTFLRGLGLVREGRGGFVRTRVEPDRPTIAAGLRDGVFPAAELLDALGTEPVSAGSAFDHVAGAVPHWERARDHDWEGTWRTRVAHLLEWLVLAGLLRRSDGGYVRA